MKRLIVFLLAGACLHAEQLKFGFLSPSFNGVGYSAHVLTIENQEYTRKQAQIQAAQAAIQAQLAAAQNTNLAKFLNNLESRIYAQISTNVANAMFTPGAAQSGTFTMTGNTIAWNTDGNNIYLTVTDVNGNQTQVTIPLGSFTFGAS